MTDETVAVNWEPPSGSVLVEPGFHEAPDGDVYCDPDWLAEHEAERHGELRRADLEIRATRVRGLQQRLDAALAQVEGLEVRLYATTELLEATLVLLGEAHDDARFGDDVLAAVLAERTGQAPRAALPSVAL